MSCNCNNEGYPYGVQGPLPGPKGDRGIKGPQGDPGVGVPVGGTADQVLAKIDSTDYNTQWVNQTGGGGTGDALTTNPLSQFAATTSAQLKGVLSDETGSGLAVFNNAPVLIAPDLGTPTALTLTNAVGLPAAGINSGIIDQARLGTGSTGSGTNFLADDKTYKPLPGGGDALTTHPLSQFAATTSLELKGVISDETGSGALVFGTSPALTTPDLGTPSAANLLNATNLPIVAGTTGTLSVLRGGTGTTTPALVAGTNVTITGTWPNQTVNSTGGAGTGDLVGPGSATDNAITRYDGTTGKLTQNSGITIADGATGALSGTNTGDQTITLTGAVTGTGTGSFATSIADGSIILAKIASMATSSFLGRVSGGSGSPESLSVATAKTLLNLAGSNSGDQTITLTGQITGTGTGSFAATLDKTAITSRTIDTAPDLTANYLLSYNSSSATLKQVKMSDMAAQLAIDFVADSISGFKGLFDTTALTADRTITVPNANSTLVVPSSGSAGQSATAINASGVVTYSRPGRSVTAKTANYTVVAITDTATLFTNTGAAGSINFNLPAAAVGETFTFSVEAAQALNTVANGTDTIRLGATVSIAGGKIASSTIGTVWTIVCTQTGKWVVSSYVATPTIT